MVASRAMRSLASVLVAAMALPAGGCLVLKPQHDELVQEVAKLRKEVLKASQTTSRANELADMLEKKLAELEEVLRRNQADLGLQVQQMQIEVQELRGAAENADNRSSTVEQELRELRSDLDGRLRQLEDKLNEATNIPEGKAELWSEAESQFKAKKYKNSRRLWRTYESRYPEDPKQPEVKFNIGLTYFSERDYKSALGEFYKIIQDAPASTVVPDALYYSGLAFAKLEQCKNAIAYFDALRQKKTKAPADYKQKAAEQIAILQKDSGDICLDDKKSAEAENK